MEEFEIELPDGRVVVVDARNREEAVQAARRFMDQNAPSEAQQRRRSIATGLFNATGGLQRGLEQSDNVIGETLGETLGAVRNTFRPEGVEASRFAGPAASVRQGGTLGFGDEISGALDASLGEAARSRLFGDQSRPAEAFSETSQAARQGISERRRNRPVTSFVEESAGAVANPATRTGAGFITRGSTLGSRTARSGAVAAPLGAVFGAGESEGGPASRATGAAIGGAVGALTGGGGVLALEGLARTGGFAANTLRNAVEKLFRRGPDANLTRPQRRAWAHVRNRLSDAGLTDEQIARQMQRWRDSGHAEDFVFELDDSLLGDAAALASDRTNRAAQQGVDRVRRRQTGAGNRVLEASRRALDSGGDEFNTARSAAVRGRNEAANTAFEAFRREAPVPASEVADLFQRPAVGKAATRVVSALQDEGRINQEQARQMLRVMRGGDPGQTNVAIPPAAFLQLKQEVADRASVAQRQGRNGEARRLFSIMGDLDDFMRQKFPDTFPQANDEFARASGVIDLFDEGRALFRSGEARANPEITAEEVRRLTPDQLRSFRIGMARGMLDEIRRTRPGAIETSEGLIDLGRVDDVASRVFGRADQQELLRAAFNDEEVFSRFARAMANEMRRSASFQRVNPDAGSRTAVLQASQRNAGRNAGDVALAATEMASDAGSGIGLVRQAGRLARMISDGRDREFEEALAQIVFSTPEESRQVLERQIRRETARRLQAQGAGRVAVETALGFAPVSAGRVSNTEN